MTRGASGREKRARNQRHGLYNVLPDDYLLISNFW